MKLEMLPVSAIDSGLGMARVAHGIPHEVAGESINGRELLAAANITSAAFSPTMYTELTMKNPGILGNTEASTTLRPVVPRTLKSPSRTANGSPSLPIAQVHEA